MQDQTEFKDSQIAQFNTILNLLYVMLLLAVVIALIGIVNTLALSIYERTRELGLLRAVGMTRAQVRTMVRDEAVIISIFGSLLGLAIGLAFGRAFVSAVSDDGIVFALPVTQLVIFVILAGIAGLPGRCLARAAGRPPRRARRHSVAIGHVERGRDLYRVLEVPWEPLGTPGRTVLISRRPSRPHRDGPRSTNAPSGWTGPPARPECLESSERKAPWRSRPHPPAGSLLAARAPVGRS